MKRFLFLLADAGTFALALFSVAGFFGRSGFAPDLLSHFRLQYAVLSLLLSVAAIIRRRGPLFAVAFAAFVINAAELRDYVSISEHRLAGSGATKIFFANVDIRNRQFDRLVDLVGTEKPDVAVFTEVNAQWADQLSALNNIFPYSLSVPREDKFGMVLFSHAPISAKEVIELPGVDFPSVIFDVTLSSQSRPLRLIAAHSPAPLGRLGYEHRNNMLRRIADMTRSQDVPTVVVGDLNITPWSPLFKDFLLTGGLRDARPGRGVFPTWPRNILPMMIPIDHCLSSGGLNITSFATTKNFGSDHLGIVCEIGF